jgi:hypothetical protein
MSGLPEEEIIRRAATAMKVLRLVHMPGMDHVAVKLNCGPTYDELKTAKAWFAAFEKCRSVQKTVFEIAEELDTGR